MTISYPLTMPTAPGFVRVSFAPSFVVGVSNDPFALTQQVYRWPGAAWNVEVELPRMRRAQAEEWLGFLLSLKGRYGTFYIGDPDAKIPRGLATGTAVTTGTNTVRAESITTSGWTNNGTGILKRGDYIQIGTSTSRRLYKVLTDANSGTSGLATFDIFPPLRATLATGTPITTGTTTGVFRLAQNTVNWDTNEMAVYGLSFSAVEAI
ncbi:hypothetical protein UFOVP1672_27 [uncultured Caudovirales phage]|uniref:Minor tail protein n=1 Tax=uncultured Caudovirales phage TaxID=2100421 RepID=A0A6J5T946_9CAUD|nr:hypothetical protein UFOVP988_49 [uncultured Caudovirales phage]CAB4210881.1 hypothetical protein UFOVP1425_49 [uncultured Caudovirales phage]CAB4223354.1 hypothetical protein UFOVP1672_27 [uncultured Caudovirales phage]